MKHNSDVPGQLALFAIAPDEKRTTIHDPYWDEVVAPEQTVGASWNLADFGEVPHKLDDGGQLSIFYDESLEPPDPDDYQNLDEYHQAWGEWEIRVRGQVNIDTTKTAPEHNTHWVEKYWVERCANKYWYYRYCWMSGRKIKRCHLGSVDSIIAKRKKADVEVWIGDGLAPVEIEKLIRQQRSPQCPMPNAQCPIP
ncbi:MAG: DUF4102 domain-containing protein [Nostoc sp.]|uniref:DUF4102 domain-containing protein n=1 Tax=Nostoc sp. TaxID=1180 RepID=UPI002FF6C6B9